MIQILANILIPSLFIGLLVCGWKFNNFICKESSSSKGLAAVHNRFVFWSGRTVLALIGLLAGAYLLMGIAAFILKILSDIGF